MPNIHNRNTIHHVAYDKRASELFKRLKNFEHSDYKPFTRYTPKKKTDF